jgi:hypothetical protein
MLKAALLPPQIRHYSTLPSSSVRNIFNSRRILPIHDKFIAMGFDFVILVFTAVALLKKHSARTDLWKLLFHDGLVYFVVSFSTNCIPAVGVLLAPLKSSTQWNFQVLNVLNLNSEDVDIPSVWLHELTFGIQQLR